MKRVLNIIPTDFIKATGLFRAEVTGPDNIVYNLYFPSTSCNPGLPLWKTTEIFSSVSHLIFDYVTIHEGNFSYESKRAIYENILLLKYAEGARANIPLKGLEEIVYE